MKTYCSENNVVFLQNSDAYKAALLPSVELIKFLIIHVFKDFARICTNHTGSVESRIKDCCFSLVFLSPELYC